MLKCDLEYFLKGHYFNSISLRKLGEIEIFISNLVITMGENTRQQEIEKVYLSILANNTHPFEQAVSRNDVRSQSDSFDISRPHQGADRRINRALQLIQRSHLPKLTPLLGEAGAGKTHYYWTLKDREKSDADSGHVEVHPWTIIYVPSPPMALNIPLHIFR